MSNDRLRTLLLLAYDAILVNLAFIVPIIIRFYDTKHISYYLQAYLGLAPFITVIFLTIFYGFKFYSRAWAYASVGELVAIVQAVTLGSLGVIAVTYFIYSSLPRSIIIMNWAFAILLVGSSRLAWRIIIERQKVYGRKPSKRAVIFGAGDAGAMVARELKNSGGNILPVGFVDDDPQKQKMRVLGLPVLGNREQVYNIVKRYNINLIIIAMPSVSNGAVREIIDYCRSTKAELKILPSIYQIIEGKVSVNHLRPVQLEDLLHRPPVQVELKEISGYLKDETVLITGAGGSIGSELCRQVATFRPRKLIIFGHGENSIHNIWLELVENFHDTPIEVEIADVRDKLRVDYIFKKHRPCVVFHAAAHKHVPLMELHPDEAIKTNIFGTLNLADAADRTGTKIFVLISTDKAVNPSSVMGATKRIAELVIQQKGNVSDTIYTAVRFGNVLGSNGSVVPIFRRQIANGSPITITHPEMKRYFMTITEAVQLVIQAGAMAKGSEIFILDMGEPIKIVDLARDMIKLSGLEPDKDVIIKYTGMRPGEKLFEELLTAEEGSCATKHKRIFVAKPSEVDMAALENILLILSNKGYQCTADDIFDALAVVVPNFKQYRQKDTG